MSQAALGEGGIHSALIIGAGMSGLCAGIKLAEKGIDDFLILEKSEGIGGTWYDNRYPGACCDVASVLYSYSFEPNPNWSRKYSPHQEIRAYFEHCADKYDLRRRLRLGCAVEAAEFDEQSSLWVLRLADGETLRARAVISGLGQLNRPNIPAFEGAESFTGDQFHTARWDSAQDLRGKRVAIIGNAASALQIIPQLAPQVERLSVYQRSANWVIKRGDRAYSTTEQSRFERFPVLQKLHRLFYYLRGEFNYFAALRSESVLRPLIENHAHRYLEEQVRDPKVRELLSPDYPAGCKRILISDDYFPAFNRPNVELVTSPIIGVGEQGVATEDGIERDVDVIIYATGFETLDMLSGVEFRGTGGRKLSEAWVDGAEAYRGVAVAGFPNLFMLYGPNTNLGHNSIIFMVERQVDYVVKCIHKLLSHQLTELEVKPTVMQAYNDKLQGDLGKTVWVSSCDSWYKNAAGKVVNNWPHSSLRYWWHMRSPEFSDFDMRL